MSADLREPSANFAEGSLPTGPNTITTRPSVDTSPQHADVSATTISTGVGTEVLTESEPVDQPVDQPVGLPTPPTDKERTAYLRGPRRWLVIVQALAFLPILYSLGRFASNHVALMFFFGWIALQLASMSIGIGTSVRKRQVSRKSHEALVAQFVADPVPHTVDIFLPTCGEPIDVLRNTYRYVSQVNCRGRVTVHVLDDAGRDEVETAAREYGFNYLSRPDKGVMKKAGNMLYAFKRTTGEFILVLDADFVPRHDILDQLLPYFGDETVGIVQSPQYFDTTRRMNWLERTAGATQELFYRWIQPSRDTMSAAICVGTSAIYRRAALDTTGGFAQIEHSEDVHTGVGIAKQGFRVRYVPVLVTKGLCPDNVKGFLSQQYRWSTGSLSLMTNREFHTNPHLPLRRRIPYFAGFLYYINSALATIVATLPGGIMFWAYPHLVRPTNYVPFLGGLAVWFLLLPLVCHSRWRPEVLRVQALYSFAYLIAVRDKVTGRHEAWVPTGNAKAKNPTAKRALRAARIGVTFNLGFTLSGLVHVTLVAGPEQVWPAYIFAALLTYVLGPILWLPHVLTWTQAIAIVVRSPFRALGKVRRRALVPVAG